MFDKAFQLNLIKVLKEQNELLKDIKTLLENKGE